ncbi:hypothetical protein [Streptomyces triticiradicis]|uniref:Uncharacterized protein n=1 Tax=Streptomyces triticiradicis TaxID=2651189 RepID=A0A7J5DBN4_9ACTN|nr:hypothetical protein [Streptomyces triticiradicis]KAB1984260.1 hypothetical protein F8144_29000 [Streptomyces triticiradicis]
MTAGNGRLGALRRGVVSVGAAVVAMLGVAFLAAALGIVEIVARHTPFGLWTPAVAVAVSIATGLIVWFRRLGDGSGRPGAKRRPGADTPVLVPCPEPSPELLPGPLSGPAAESVLPVGADNGSPVPGPSALHLKRSFLAALEARDTAEAARLLAAVAALPGQRDWVAGAGRRLDVLRSQMRRSRP